MVFAFGGSTLLGNTVLDMFATLGYGIDPVLYIFLLKHYRQHLVEKVPPWVKNIGKNKTKDDNQHYHSESTPLSTPQLLRNNLHLDEAHHKNEHLISDLDKT